MGIDLRGGQEARAGKDGRAHVEEIEPGELADKVEVGLEEGADGSNVLPVALEDVGEDAVLGDGAGDDVLAEVGVLVVEQADDEIAVEDVDAHRGEEEILVALDAEAVVGFTGNFQLRMKSTALIIFARCCLSVLSNVNN